LRISGEMRGQPDTWLTLVDDLPLTSLAYLDWGLGLLSFRLEFVSHNSPNHLDSSDQLGSCYELLSLYIRTDDVTSLAQETSFKYFLVLDVSSLLSPFSPITLVISDSDIHIFDQSEPSEFGFETSDALDA